MTNNERISANNEELRGILDTVQDLPDAGGGYDEGYEAGYGEGFNYGRDEGYETGYMEGRDEGMDEGYARGKQAEYDAFWDAYQQNGARRDYSRAFSGIGWTKEAFRPKYDIIAAGTCQLMFADSFGYNTPGWDLAAHLEECGVTLDFSKATYITGPFSYTNFTRIGVCDFSSATTFSGMFTYSDKLVTIDKIIMPKTQTSGNLHWFGNCSKLENVTFEGEIMLDGLNMTYSPNLTHASLMSIINALKDYSGTGITRTVALGDANAAKLSDAEYLIAVNKGWTVVPARTIATDFVMCENCQLAKDDPDGTLYGSECPECGGCMLNLICSECGAKADSAEDIYNASDCCMEGIYVPG